MALEKTDRNELIVNLRKDGWSWYRIASHVGLTLPRTQQAAFAHARKYWQARVFTSAAFDAAATVERALPFPGRWG